MQQIQPAVQIVRAVHSPIMMAKQNAPPVAIRNMRLQQAAPVVKQQLAETMLQMIIVSVKQLMPAKSQIVLRGKLTVPQEKKIAVPPVVICPMGMVIVSNV